MSDDTEMDYGEAMQQLHEATNKLRVLAGEEPKPFTKPVAPYCSFCGKGKNEVSAMLQGPNVHICNECVRACQMLLEGQVHD